MNFKKHFIWSIHSSPNEGLVSPLSVHPAVVVAKATGGTPGRGSADVTHPPQQRRGPWPKGSDPRASPGARGRRQGVIWGRGHLPRPRFLWEIDSVECCSGSGRRAARKLRHCRDCKCSGGKTACPGPQGKPREKPLSRGGTIPAPASPTSVQGFNCCLVIHLIY